MSIKVNKELAPEEVTLLSNIQSSINEMLQAQQGGGQPGGGQPAMEEQQVMEQVAPMTEETILDEATEEKEIKMILKELISTSSDGATASDDAETQLEDPLPDPSAEKLSQVAKTTRSVIRALKNAGMLAGVQKSQSSQTVQKARVMQTGQDPAILDLINQMAEIQKSSQAQVNDLTIAVGHVLDGMGVAKQLEITTQPAAKGIQQVNKAQSQELLNMLKDIVGNQVEKNDSEVISQGSQVRKNLNAPGIAHAIAGVHIPGERIR